MKQGVHRDVPAYRTAKHKGEFRLGAESTKRHLNRFEQLDIHSPVSVHGILQNAHDSGFVFVQENVQVAAVSAMGMSCSSTTRPTAVRTRGCRLFLTQASQTTSRCVNRRGGRRLAHDWHSRRSRQMQQYLPSHGSRQFKQRSMLHENIRSNASIERRRYRFMRAMQPFVRPA
jgi:hypothetical protein